MARIEWVKLRLNNWALWKVRNSCGGMGFARVSVLLANRVDESRESPIPVDEIDAEKTNKAVESLRPKRMQLYQTLQCVYIDGIGIKGTARKLGAAESTIKALLDQADHALSEWFGLQAEAAKAKERMASPASIVEGWLR